MMRSTTTLRNRRPREGAGDLRFRAALLLVLCAAAAGWLVLSRDVGWPARRRTARARALAAESARDYPLARSHYEAALAADPFDWETRLGLANLLNHRLRVRDAALRHYLLALAYSPDSFVADETEAEIDVIRLLAEGGLEDPADALEDMFLAVEAGAKAQFAGRLDIWLLEGGDRVWDVWRGRGRGEIVFSRIESGGRGMYGATVELAFADGTSVSLLLRCPLRNIWRLSASFP